MAKRLIVWPTKVELHPLHVNLYTTLDLSSKAKEVLRDDKHVFNFLVVKIIYAPDICRNFAANRLDGLPQYGIVKWGVSLSTIYHFSVRMSSRLKFFFPSMIWLRVSNTTLSDQFLDIDFQFIVSDFFPMLVRNFPMLRYF